jgi:AI-2 transport protein TqsA
MADPPATPTLREPPPRITVATWLVIAAAGWYLLRELAGLLRPLAFAVFLAYVILPIHLRLRQSVPPLVSVVLMLGGSLGLLFLLVLLIQGSVAQLNAELPELNRRALALTDWVKSYWADHLPWWLANLFPQSDPAESHGLNLLRQAVGAVANAAASALTGALVVGFYLLFILLEAAKVPQRIRNGFGEQRASEILQVVGNINEAIASYLRVKVLASAILALPVTIVLWALGVKFALLWGVLTFLCNFIPYIGSVVAYTLPVVFGFLQLAPAWQSFAAAGLLLAIHMVTAYVTEPSMTGRAVGLSPLIILLSLAFWGQCWGLIGMLLAVPLTVVLKIILENVPLTRPVGKLLADE